MAYDGSGNYNRPVSDYVFDTVISETDVNLEMSGIATGLSTVITKNGQTTITANLPMAGYRHTGVGSAAARTDYAAFGQVQDGKANWVDGGGTADAITATYSPAYTALIDGMLCVVRATAANATTTPTFAPSGLTARTIVKEGGTALRVGDIAGDSHDLLLRYDLANTQWELLNPAFSDVPRTNDANTFTGETNLDGPLALGDGSELTIATGSITPTANEHTVDTEADAASDALTDIDDANMQPGAILLLRAEDGARTVVVTNGTGNHKINLADDNDFSLDDAEKSIILRLRGGEWYEVNRSLTAATQAQQEAGADLVAAVTPGRQQYHPSAAKAWAVWDHTGTAALADSFNVTSLTDLGTGDARITFSTAFSSANYAFAVGAGRGVVSSDAIVNQGAGPTSADPTTTAFRLAMGNASSSTAVDFEFASLIVFGDQ